MAKKPAGNLTPAEEFDEFLISKGISVGNPRETATPPAIFYGTGIPAIDYALGGDSGMMGGLPSGQITEIYGSNAVGKTSLIYRMIAEAQRKYPHKTHIIFDYERVMDDKYAAACGVDMGMDKLRIWRPDTIQDGFKILFAAMLRLDIGIVAFDSVAAMMPAQDLDRRNNSLDDAPIVASKSKVMSDMLTYALVVLGKSNETALAFINHEIATIPQGFSSRYTPSRTTPGGDRLKYLAALRIELIFRGTVTSDKKKDFYGDAYKAGIGKEIEMYIEKFKFGNPHSKVRYQILGGEGIDLMTPLIDTAESHGVLVRSKNTYTLTLPGYETFKVVGVKDLREAIRTNGDLRNALTDAVGTYEMGVSRDTPPESYELPESVKF